MTACGIELKSLRKEFGALVAVEGASFSVAAGSVHGFVGPNGAGKTTLIRMLATVLPPSSGDAFAMGRSIVEEPEEVRRLIGFVPDSFAGSGAMTIHEYLDFFARSCGLRGQQRRAAVEDVERLCGLEPLREKLVAGLSRGMQQRLSVGRALVNDPSVLLLDEPAANLDPKARVEFRELVRKLAARGKTLLISSHILPELSEICDSVTILSKGRVVASGSLNSVLAAGSKARIRVRALCPREELEKALSSFEGVSALQASGASLDFELEGGEQKAAQLLKALVERGLPLVEFKTASDALEAAFLAAVAEMPEKEAAKP
jgi:ABC-2 type transport system ATP-binding protein